MHFPIVTTHDGHALTNTNTDFTTDIGQNQKLALEWFVFIIRKVASQSEKLSHSFFFSSETKSD